MKVSDYIVEFLISKGITDVFGYPGGMVTHLMDSFSKYEDQVRAHLCYHEQAAAFEACSYAQVSHKAGFAYATSGPGATNMITGICNAYFDSIPVIFITGQVNTFESNNEYQMRQRGFQETNIVDMVKGVTKLAVYVDDAHMIKYYLEKAYLTAIIGRKGPVLLDIPMDVQRTNIDPKYLKGYEKISNTQTDIDFPAILGELKEATRPCILLGAACKEISKFEIESFVNHMGIPIVTSMIAMDVLSHNHRLNFGYIGAYGSRTANFIVAKSDFVLVLGSRLDVRQVGGKRDNFAPDAVIVRVDIDKNELDYPIRTNGIRIHADIKDVMKYLGKNYPENKEQYTRWLQVCQELADKLNGLDDKKYNCFVKKISEFVPRDTVITTDVGQNQVWVAQSFRVKSGQQVLFSGGHGAMGYSLPAAIGAYYATHRPVICFSGDGGIQMNIQELEFIKRERLPIKIFIFNNFALGMIRHFQEMYFEGNYVQTVSGNGYEAPEFEQISKAYEIPYIRYDTLADVSGEFMNENGPVLIEIKLKEDTYVFPKLEFGKPNQDQESLLDRNLYHYLMELGTEQSKSKNGGGIGYLTELYIPQIFQAMILYFCNKKMRRWR